MDRLYSKRRPRGHASPEPQGAQGHRTGGGRLPAGDRAPTGGCCRRRRRGLVLLGPGGRTRLGRLVARRFAAGKLDDEITLAQSAAGDTLADAGGDHAGRVWVVWQSMRRGRGDIFARWLDPRSGKWSAEIAVSKPRGGNWEPRVAFDGREGAWVVFDSSRTGNFNLYLAHVGLKGDVEEKQITRSPHYEARASIAAALDGKSLWIAAERGASAGACRPAATKGLPAA